VKQNLRIVALFPPGLLTLAVFAITSSGFAQLTQREIEENSIFSSDDLTLPVFVPESENDDDLGVQLALRPEEKYDPFNLYGNVGWYFTDNAAVTETNRLEDSFLNASATLTYLPIIRGNLYGEATIRENTFRYNENSDLDFDTIDLGSGFVYVIRGLGDLAVFARYNYGTYLDPNDGWGQLYENHSIQAGAYKPWILKRNHFLQVSYVSDVSLEADPGFAQRDDHSVTLSYRWTPIRKFRTDFYVRSSYLDYRENSRDDWNTSAGATLTYNLTPNLRLSSSVMYTHNQSNFDGGDYEVWVPGFQLGGIIQF